MSGTEPGSETRDDARFRPPPEVGAASGAITVGAGRDDLATRVVQAAFVGTSLAWSLVALELTPEWRLPPLLATGALALPIGAAWELAARAPRRTIRWDAWGLTDDVRGARTAIAWAGARVWVARGPRSVIVRVVDEDGRAIACAWGADLPGWARSSVARREDVERLIDAVGALPRSEAPPPSRPIFGRAIGAATAVGAALVIAIGAGHTAGLLIAQAVLALAAVPDVRRAGELARRAWALRGARTVEVARGPAVARGELALARPDGRVIPLVTDEVPHDARLADRGEPVRVTLADTRDGDPYRVRARAHATRIESSGERRARHREAGWIAARVGMVAAAIGALALAWAPALPPPRPRAEAPPMPSLAGPRPSQPTAWRSPPRAPILHRGVRATCERPGVRCQPVIAYLDEVGREVYRCGSLDVRSCEREMREAIPDAVIEEE